MSEPNRPALDWAPDNIRSESDNEAEQGTEAEEGFVKLGMLELVHSLTPRTKTTIQQITLTDIVFSFHYYKAIFASEAYKLKV